MDINSFIEQFNWVNPYHNFYKIKSERQLFEAQEMERLVNSGTYTLKNVSSANIDYSSFIPSKNIDEFISKLNWYNPYSDEKIKNYSDYLSFVNMFKRYYNFKILNEAHYESYSTYSCYPKNLDYLKTPSISFNETLVQEKGDDPFSLGVSKKEKTPVSDIVNFTSTITAPLLCAFILIFLPSDESYSYIYSDLKDSYAWSLSDRIGSYIFYFIAFFIIFFFVIVISNIIASKLYNKDWSGSLIKSTDKIQNLFPLITLAISCIIFFYLNK